MARSAAAQAIMDRMSAVEIADCPNGHRQSVTTYCVADDDGQCIRYGSTFIDPDDLRGL